MPRKSKPREIERYSPEWINSIPRSLARGIWDTIESGAGGAKPKSRKREMARRVLQIDRGILKPESRGVCRYIDVGEAEQDSVGLCGNEQQAESEPTCEADEPGAAGSNAPAAPDDTRAIRECISE